MKYLHWPDNFWARVDVKGDDDCWEWTGVKISRKDGRKYGRVTIHGIKTLAHRASWVLAHGEIPPDTEVCHECDNPSCVNPGHLFLGTHQDNMDDMNNKGRRVNIRAGEEHPMAKLTWNDVNEIRSLYDTGRFSFRTLGEMFHVHEDTIKNAVRGKNWRVR